MAIRYVRPTTNEIFNRHEGPYTLCAISGKLGKTVWHRTMLLTRNHVETAVRVLFEDPATRSVSVWSESLKYYVTTYGRGDLKHAGQVETR